MRQNPYKDRIVIVTGAGRGIGRYIAEAYAYQGAQVVLAEKDQDSGLEVERVINSQDQRGHLILTDVSNPQDITELFEQVQATFGAVHILINNAGISRFEAPYQLTVEAWDQIINTNLRSVFLCSRAAAQIMRLTGGGSIVNIASTRAFMSEENSEAYAASKGGVIALTHALAASFASDQIQVNSISPGWIETGDVANLRPVDHRQHWSRRVGTPKDIADACLFLTDPQNNFINGTNLIIDGGMTKKMIYAP